MIRQLLEEVKAAPLDEASRNRLKEIHQASIKELEEGLAPELVEELERLTLPFSEDGTPSEGELRIAQAQLVGWLEGLFHGIQTAIYAQQMAAKMQFEQIRRGLPPGMGVAAGAARGPEPAAPARRLGRDVPLGRRPRRPSPRTTTSPSRPIRTSAMPGAAARDSVVGSPVSHRGELGGLGRRRHGVAALAEELSRPCRRPRRRPGRCRRRSRRSTGRRRRRRRTCTRCRPRARRGCTPWGPSPCGPAPPRCRSRPGRRG